MNTCNHCGSKFKGYNGNPNKYCSRECYNKDMKNRETAVCKNKDCSKEIRYKKSANRKYCSRECYFDDRKNRVGRVCKYCGDNFEVRKSRLKYNSGVYCSKKCAGEGRRNRIIKKCINCDNTFEVKNYRGSTAFFCSEDCYGDYGRTESICGHCDEPFDHKKSVDRRYCSDECANKEKGREKLYPRTRPLRRKIQRTIAGIKHRTEKATGIDKEDIPQPYIDFKHTHIKLKRKIDQL